MINLALIGVGNWGKNYLKTVEKIPQIQIKYVCATTDKSLNSIDDKYKKIKNYKELLKFDDINGVIIATPSWTHFKIAKDLIHKFNLLIEKPIVEDYNEINELIALQNISKNKILVGHVYMFDPAFIKTKELISELGKIRYIYYEGNNNGPIREKTSVLWDIGPHAISLILEAHNIEPKSVSTWAVNSYFPKSKQFDLVILRILFKDGLAAFIKINWIHPYKKRELIIAGEKNILVYNDMQIKRVSLLKDALPVKNVNLFEQKPKISFPKYSMASPLENEIMEFIRLIKGENKTRSDMYFGKKVTFILSQAEKSILDNGAEKTLIG